MRALLASMRPYARGRRAVADGARDALGGFRHQRSPLHLHAVGRRGERQRRDQRAVVVADPGGDAAHAELGFLVVGGPALALDALELLLEQRHARQRVAGVRGKPGALGVVAQPREAFLEQEQLARRGDVQRRARADHVHHAHRRAARRGALHVHDLVAVAHREVGGLAGLRVQLAHHRQRELAHADARLHQVAELEQAHAEAVAAGLHAVDDAVGGHRGEDAVRGRGMQPGVLRDLLQAERLGMLREHVEQAHHAVDDLDRALLLVVGRHRKAILQRVESAAMPVVTCIEDLREMAKKRVARAVFEYVDCGSYTQATLRANRADLESLALRQRVGIDVDRRSTRTTMIGEPVAMPVALAPVGLTGLNWADGEILAARAAHKFGVPFTLSTMSICSIEDVADAVRKPFWFQLYVMRERGFAASLIERARAANCSALVMTLDLQIQGQRHRDLINGLTVPPRLTAATLWDVARKPGWVFNVLTGKRKSFGNLEGRIPDAKSLTTLGQWIAGQFDPTLSWQDVEWVKKLWGGKLVLKGILDP